jgi:hypothetical protein
VNGGFQDTEFFGLRIQVLKLGLRESVMAGRGREDVPVVLSFDEKPGTCLSSPGA